MNSEGRATGGIADGTEKKDYMTGNPTRRYCAWKTGAARGGVVLSANLAGKATRG